MTDVPPPQPVQPVWKAILCILTVAAWAPIVLAFAASGIASTMGCKLDEGGSHPCILAGHDIGDTLYTMAMMMWLALLTFPLIAISAVGWLVVWVKRTR